MRTPRRHLPRWARTLARLAALYAVVVFLAWHYQSKLLYPGAGRADLSTHPDARPLTYAAHDGTPVHALLIDAPRRTVAPQTVVYFHGNGEVIGDKVGMANAIASRGFRVVLVEYRGFGVSQPGEPSEQGLYADAEAVLDGLASDGVGKERIVLWGVSLGTGVAMEMASRGRGGALVLVAPYTSMVDVGWDHMPFLPVTLLLRDRYDSLKKAASVHVPTVVLHGTDDEVVPFAMGKRLASVITGATFIEVKGGHHMDTFVGAGGRYFDEVAAVVKRGIAP